MSAINNPLTFRSGLRADPHADTEGEMARHAFDLRIHALIMALSGALVAYSGFRMIDVNPLTVTGQPIWIGLSSNTLALFALAVLSVIAGFCFFEAVQCWKRAVRMKTRVSHKGDVKAVKTNLPPDEPDGGASGELPQTPAAFRLFAPTADRQFA